MSTASRLERIGLLCALGATIAITACDRSEPAGTAPEASGTASPTAEATGTGAPAAEGTAAPSEGTGGNGQPAADNFVTDGSGNRVECQLKQAEEGDGLVCPDGCVMVKGAPVDETNSCARVGLRWEVAMGCIAPPVGVLPGGACYVDQGEHHVLTAITYAQLLSQGWSYCPETYAYRSAPPCPEQVLPVVPAEGSAAAPAAPTGTP